MALLQDLIPDPTTKDLWQCRPAATSLVKFTSSGFSSGFSIGFGGGGFNLPTFVSCMKVVGSRVYGMVSTSRNPGQDEPFCYDLVATTFVPITGVTAANTPLSPSTGGAWNPPNIDLIGRKLIVSHPGFTGAGNGYFGVIDITAPAAPVWSSGNTTVNALVAPPQWVQNFNGRCFFLVNPAGAQPAVYMSDQLNPTVITNANQILTFGDNIPLTCAAGLPLQSQLGGIVQALMVFKGVSNIFQVTGDYSLSNLATNALNVATGTLGPNTVVATSKGLGFIAPDGLRVIDFNARVSDPIGHTGDGAGVTTPFINAVVPSRMSAAYNSGVYRVQVNNGATGTQQQWWYDFVRQIWSGPHTQQASLMAPYAGTFIVTLQAGEAQLFQSDSVQSTASSFVENGVPLSWVWATPMLPDTDEMAQIAIIETTLHMALVAGSTVTVSAQDQNGAYLDQVSVTPAGASTLWGAFNWGAAPWQGALNALFPKQLLWHFPLVFQRMGVTARGLSAAGIKIGRLHLRYQVLGYLQQGT
ncbi:MAG: hypothetical protein KGL35_24890 [Bradyrhizobium sp.]|nr:hypothetical protein [Bradyrhizobium sp.]